MATRKGAAVTIQGTSKSIQVGGRFNDLKPTYEAANDVYTPRIDEDRGKSRTSADDDDDDDFVDEAIGDKGTGRKEEAGWKSKSVGGWNKGSNGTKVWAATGARPKMTTIDGEDEEAIGGKSTGKDAGGKMVGGCVSKTNTLCLPVWPDASRETRNTSLKTNYISL